MGLSISACNTPKRFISNVSDFVRGTKRKLNSRDNDDETNNVIDVAMHAPKRKRVETTAQYIYQVLYKEGKNSDVKVTALGVDFLLHKIYLCQSPYFASMFGGSWLETEKSSIVIDIIDPVITKESLGIVFGSLYCDEIILDPCEVIPILATATMLQLDGVIDKCREVMIETISPPNALEYYNAACLYGDTKLKECCVKWFLVNLMTYLPVARKLEVQEFVPIQLMAQLLSHPDLCVMKTEIAVYVQLTTWMYSNLHPERSRFSAQDVTNYFTSRKNEVAFLLTELGQPYLGVYKSLRLQHLISHHVDIELIIRDNIIPLGWIQDMITQQWRMTLKVNQNDEKGPRELTDATFLRTSLRCGRTLEKREKHMWRWTGFHYGLDLIMIADDRSLSVKRNHRPEFEQLLSLQTVRHVAIRVTVYTLNEQKQVTYTQCSGVKYLSLAKSEEITILNYEPPTFPLVISANILFVSPGEMELGTVA